MATKLKHTSSSLLNKQFIKKGAGYDSFDVDSLFDEVINDYRVIEANHLMSHEEFQNLTKEIEKLKKENITLKVELDNEKSKLKYIKKDDIDIHLDNLELLKRIGRLEAIIHEKLHLNPDEIINFDPDDCWH